MEYGKNNNRYWDGAKLYQQVINKTLPITKVLYPGYSLLFYFDNAINHSIYTKDILQVKDIKKGIGGQKPQLRNRWFNHDNNQINQLINFQKINGQWT